MSIDNIKVGDYVRTKNGNIRKIIEITNKEYDDEPDYLVDKGMIDIVKKEETTYIENWLFKEQIIKSSPNIIDLIEYGDIIGWKTKYNGGVNEVVGNKEPSVYATEEDRYVPLSEIEIVSIITHEQMKAMEYKIEK